MGRASSSRGRQLSRPENSPFTTFVTNVITRAELTTPVILASLVYIDRAKPHLHIALEEWALERVFLGAVIVASKVCFPFSIMPRHTSADFFFVSVFERLHTEERSLGVMHWCLRETRRRSHRTRIPGCPRFPARHHRRRPSLTSQ
jgi:hypothetical protein